MRGRDGKIPGSLCAIWPSTRTKADPVSNNVKARTYTQGCLLSSTQDTAVPTPEHMHVYTHIFTNILTERQTDRERHKERTTHFCVKTKKFVLVRDSIAMKRHSEQGNAFKESI